MLHLLAKTNGILDAFERCFPDEPIPKNDPLSYLEMGRKLLTFYTLGMPYSEPLMEAFLNSGSVSLLIQESTLIVTGNVQGWHHAIRSLLNDSRKAIQKFAAMLVQQFYEIFKDLSHTLKPDGTIALR